MTLILPTDLREATIEHAREGSPQEVVGLLAGDRSEERSTVTRRYPAENAAETPRTRYEIAPAEELALLKRIEAAGLDVVGFYHSHPEGPPAPSETDARLAAWPGHSYVIVSLAGEEPQVGSWRWSGDTFQRERIETE